jgi:aldehyde:ferredoxin oxidoreductase
MEIAPGVCGAFSRAPSSTLASLIHEHRSYTVWIRGKASRPVYIKVDEKGVQFRDAGDLWGGDTYQTVDTLKQREGNDVEVATIGIAGENGLPFSSIQNGYHSFGRTGLGAVMGGKLLKAICFGGRGAVGVKDRKRYSKIAKVMKERILASDAFGYTRRYGSMVVSDVYNRLGILPGLNFQKGSFDDWESTRGRRFFEETFKERDFACFACPIGCLHWSKVKDGAFAGMETHGLEVTYALEVGGRLGISDIPEIFATVELCNRAGMDVISTCSETGRGGKRARKSGDSCSARHRSAGEIDPR